MKHLWHKNVEPYDHTLELSDDPASALALLESRSENLMEPGEQLGVGATRYFSHATNPKERCEVADCLGIHTFVIINKPHILEIGREDLLARTIVHESVHAAIGVLEAAGVKDESGESLAYLTDSIYGWIVGIIS